MFSCPNTYYASQTRQKKSNTKLGRMTIIDIYIHIYVDVDTNKNVNILMVILEY